MSYYLESLAFLAHNKREINRGKKKMSGYKVNNKENLTAAEALNEIKKVKVLNNISIPIEKDPNVKPSKNPKIILDTKFVTNALRIIDKTAAKELTLKFENCKSWENCDIIVIIKGKTK